MQLSRLRKWFYGALASAFVLDFTSIVHTILANGSRELNPFVRWWLDFCPHLLFLCPIAVSLLILLLWKKLPSEDKFISFGIACIYLGTGILNICMSIHIYTW